MCGFVGWIGVGGRPPAGLRRQALDSLVSRGPDSEGEWSGEGVWLGFRRLSVLDLAARANQPMVSAETGAVVVFNGEIYNYVELRQELEHRGRHFHTSGDTEVLLQGYAEWGVDVFGRLNGMWACAIFDPARRGVVLSRDRFGEKPLYLGRDGKGAWWFGSQLRTLCDAGVGDRRLDGPRALSFLLFGASEDPEGSIVEGIRQVPPGSWMLASAAGPGHERRWHESARLVEESWPRHVDPPDGALVRATLDRAVRLRLRSDVPVGTSLSGGIDSSAIVSSMRRVAPDAEITTFTASFPGASIDEWDRAQVVGRSFGCAMVRVVPTVRGFLDDLDDLVLQQGGPIESPTVYAQWAVMRAAKEAGVTVLLDGQGADETWGGYPKHVGFALADDLTHLRLATASRTIRVWRRAGGLPSLPVAQIGGLLAPAPVRSSLLRLARQLNAAALGDALRGVHPWDPQALSGRRAVLRTAASVDVAHAVLPRLLRYADRNSMRWSREVRLPFLDPEVVALGLRSGWANGIRSGWTKLALRLALDPVLPPEIVWRRDKTAYEVPDAEWLAHPEVRRRVTDADAHLIELGIVTSRGLEVFNPWRRLSLSTLVLQYGLSI